MSNLEPPAKSVSLDDLLKANKSQFDTLFADQMGANGLVETTLAPVTEEDLSSASLEAAAPAPTPAPTVERPVPAVPEPAPSSAPRPISRRTCCSIAA